MYETEITFHIYADNEYTIHEDFETLQEAVDHVKRKTLGTADIALAWINDRRVYPKNGGLYDVAGDEVCTNRHWHRTFAPENVKIPEDHPLAKQRAPFIPGWSKEEAEAIYPDRSGMWAWAVIFILFAILAAGSK